MVKLFSRLFKQGNAPREAKVLGTRTYNDFEIRAEPIKEEAGWRIAGSLVKLVDDAEKIHRFIRADTCADEKTAVEMTLAKGQRIIDEQGDRVFDKKT